jgi:hypothetical protein
MEFKDGLPWGGGSDEELGAVGVLSSIGHGEETLLGVLQLEVLIWELVAVDYHQLVSHQSHDSAYTYLTCHQFHHP